MVSTILGTNTSWAGTKSINIAGKILNHIAGRNVKPSSTSPK